MNVESRLDGLLPRPLRHLDRPLDVIRHFTPNWFAATMGTGILALALPQVPGAGSALHALGEALWMGNIALFSLFALLYAARWLLFGAEARRIFGHNTVSMFIGTIPMGLSTLLNGLLTFGVGRWGAEVLPLAQYLWGLNVAMALACGVGIPFLMFTRQEHALDGMTAVWLLPVVAAAVAATTGGVLAPQLEGQAAFVTLIVSYALWACSIPIAFGILVILILRMALHKLPPASMAASSWLTLGPLGTGALGLLVLGQAAPAILDARGLAEAGAVAQGIGLVGALMLWGFGLWWLLLASLITACYFRADVPFNLGWWGYIFPLGVYALATLKIGAALDLAALGVLGGMLVGVLTLMWGVVAARTARGGWHGTLFHAPCLDQGTGTCATATIAPGTRALTL
ncbi:TDT family transporter [Parapedomonas caeni]